jgi:hypothetical protein
MYSPGSPYRKSVIREKNVAQSGQRKVYATKTQIFANVRKILSPKNPQFIQENCYVMIFYILILICAFGYPNYDNVKQINIGKDEQWTALRAG